MTNFQALVCCVAFPDSGRKGGQSGNSGRRLALARPRSLDKSLLPMTLTSLAATFRTSFLTLGQRLTESLPDRRIGKLGVIFHRPTNIYSINSHPISLAIPTPRAEVHPDLH